MVHVSSRRWVSFLFLFILVSLCSLPSVGASKDDDERTLTVLYLGNDYYQVGEQWIDANHFIIEALESSRFPSFIVEHRPPPPPPPTLENGYQYEELEFDKFDVVIFSEVWCSHFTDDQLEDLEEFVEDGGGFIMFGGWGGYGGRPPYGGWDGSIVEKILPVKIQSNDDAVDMDFKMKPKRKLLRHPIIHKLNWRKMPPLHGYNNVKVKKRGVLLAVNSVNKAPILVVGTYHKGRVVAFTSNPAGGWGMDFVEWSSYDEFIRMMVAWSANLLDMKSGKH